MATIEDWNKYTNLLHEFALIEDDLRETAVNGNQRASAYASRLLFERFGVSTNEGVDTGSTEG